MGMGLPKKRKMRLLMGLAIARNWIIKPKQEDTKFSDAGHVACLPAWLGFFSFNIGIEMSIFYRNL
jgi:hypothetical protein